MHLANMSYDKRCFFTQVVKSNSTSFCFSLFIYGKFYSTHSLAYCICCSAYLCTGVKNGSNQRVIQGSKTLSCCFQALFMFIKLSQLISLFFCLPTLPNSPLVNNEIVQITEKQISDPICLGRQAKEGNTS